MNFNENSNRRYTLQNLDLEPKQQPKTFELDFLDNKTNFPAGPFILAEKFNVPVVFVYAVKGAKTHYDLFATDPLEKGTSADLIAKSYVESLGEMTRKYPTQWFNFYKYYAHMYNKYSVQIEYYTIG